MSDHLLSQFFVREQAQDIKNINHISAINTKKKSGNETQRDLDMTNTSIPANYCVLTTAQLQE